MFHSLRKSTFQSPLRKAPLVSPGNPSKSDSRSIPRACVLVLLCPFKPQYHHFVNTWKRTWNIFQILTKTHSVMGLVMGGREPWKHHRTNPMDRSGDEINPCQRFSFSRDFHTTTPNFSVFKALDFCMHIVAPSNIILCFPRFSILGKGVFPCFSRWESTERFMNLHIKRLNKFKAEKTTCIFSTRKNFWVTFIQPFWGLAILHGDSESLNAAPGCPAESKQLWLNVT